jgi:hypothetical protein
VKHKIFISVFAFLAFLLNSCMPNTSFDRTPRIIKQEKRSSLADISRPLSIYNYYTYLDTEGNTLEVHLFKCERTGLKFNDVTCQFSWHELSRKDAEFTVKNSDFILETDDGALFQASTIEENDLSKSFQIFLNRDSGFTSIRFDGIPLKYKNIKSLEFDRRVKGIRYENIEFNAVDY